MAGKRGFFGGYTYNNLDLEKAVDAILDAIDTGEEIIQGNEDLREAKTACLMDQDEGGCAGILKSKGLYSDECQGDKLCKYLQEATEKANEEFANDAINIARYAEKLEPLKPGKIPYRNLKKGRRSLRKGAVKVAKSIGRSLSNKFRSLTGREGVPAEGGGRRKRKNKRNKKKTHKKSIKRKPKTAKKKHKKHTRRPWV